ncbi:MAG: ABC transporter permease [Kofleriaceae bacterium]
MAGARAMTRFLIGRLVAAAIVVFVIATVSFFLLHAAPGGPFDTAERRSAEVQRAMEERYGLHDPLWQQYTRAIGKLITGDLGYSMRTDQPVSQLIGDHFPVSAKIGLLGLISAVLLGVALGVAAARHKNTWVDYVAMPCAVLGISVPAFVVGPLLIAAFSLGLGWLPPARIDGPGSYILPAISLGLVYLGTVARLARGGMIETLSHDYIRTARAKGLSERAVVWKHALRLGVVPVVTYLGPATATMISGSFVVEKIFQVPGLGTYFIKSIADRDYPVLTGVFVFYAVLLVVLNLVVDLAYGVIDPRTRMANR